MNSKTNKPIPPPPPKEPMPPSTGYRKDRADTAISKTPARGNTITRRR